MASIIGGVITGVLGLANKYIADPAERDKFAVEMATLQQQTEQAQLQAETQVEVAQAEVNKVEAEKEEIFISGWRPFIGWICGFAMAYHFILQPFITFIFACFNHSVSLPTFDMGTLNTVLMGMLGLGAMRTVEKLQK